MNFKRLLITTALSLSLACCASKGGDTGGGEPKAKTKLFTDIADFLETRGVTVTALTYIDAVSDEKVIYTDSFAGDSEYYPYFEFTVEGNVLEEALIALKTAEWTVPDAASEYGYECINKEETIEVDITYNDEDDLEYDIHAGTDFVIYSYADITGGGSEGGDEPDDDAICEEVAIAIAKNIYGDDQAAIEENMIYFLFYFVYTIVDGTDLVAAVDVGARYLPSGFTKDGETEIGTETEDDGSSYDYASAYYVREDGLVVEIDTYVSEEDATKTEIVFCIFLGYDGGEEEGDDSSDTIYEEIQNEDGSTTVNVDFSLLGDQGVFEGCISDGWLIAVNHSIENYNAPTYLDSGEALRLYHDTGLMFSAESEFRIVNIKFTSVSASKKTVLVDDTNLTITNGTYTVSNNEVTITPDEDKNDVVMDLNIGNSGHIAFSTLSFTYIAK